MARLISLPNLIASLVVLGVARACWYYVYLENPYDYYHRYCAVGCAGMDQSDENFGQCCLPLTSGQETPAICSSLSDKCAAEGTTCEWGREVPTTDQPSTEAPPSSYTPPPYTPPATTENAAMPTTESAPAPSTSTEVVWVTETTTTPCATTSEAPPPPEETIEPCVCPTEGETSMAAAPTESAGEGALPPDGISVEPFQTNGRRGWRKRGSEECVCPTSGQAAAPTSSSPPPPPPPTLTPTSTSAPPPEECVCPPEGETSMAAAPTESAGEGALPPDNYSAEPFSSSAPHMARGFRRGYRRTNGDCECPAPPPPPADDCVCPTAGETSMAAAPTESAGEGALPPDNYSAEPFSSGASRRAFDLHRGYRRTTGDECVCPSAAPTPSATAGEGNTPLAMRRNTPPANYGVTARAVLNGREATPVVTVTSTSMVTTDDCVPAPTETSGEGSLPPAKRRYARWSDF
ncbi:hypothetical protein I316_07412 [Kwoniella heveanensis BCC8398]|uniref:Uncharacterized protein n=1 Tax=Kwoniella heveanensis BCC8398 TaxID=1296120 RepID=A0A1B9GIR3_9TREE|nr:hypothetical protein I316_07412 [Kwoniella heveanensis BCC8398]